MSRFAEWKQPKIAIRNATRRNARPGSARTKTKKEFLRQTALEEKAHSRILNTMSAPPLSLGPKGLLDTILKRERWHGRGGGWVADAIYGVNDGLGAVFGIVSGVAGATNNQQHYILIAGLAGMMASVAFDGRRRLSCEQERTRNLRG